MNYDIDLNQIKEYNSHDLKLNANHAALFVIEMQEVFRTEMAMISKKQIDNVKKLIEYANKNSIKIIYVRHNDSAPGSQHMINWWGGDKIEYGADNWKIINELDTSDGTIIDKSQYSAFYNTNLEKILKNSKVTDVIISGVMTNCCCETAARDAFMRGFNVFFVNDATATINQDLHLSAIKNLAFGFANVVNTEQIIN